MSSSRSRRRVATALVAALLAGGGTAWATRAEPTAPTAQALPSAVPFTVPPVSAREPEIPRRSKSRPEPGPDRGSADAATGPGDVVTPAPPTSVVIARLGVRMAIRAVGVARDGQMALPVNPAEAGWYRYGPRPGDRAGAAVLAAHIDAPGYGIGPLARLGQLRRGDIITVESRAVSRRYVVSSTRNLDKSSLDLRSVFARTGPPRLHLITCGGDFDAKARHYEQNVVVLAVPDPAT